MKGRALRKHSLHEKTAASVLLKTENLVELKDNELKKTEDASSLSAKKLTNVKLNLKRTASLDLCYTKIQKLEDDLNERCCIDNKLMKGKALTKHSLHEKTAASVLLKLFISSNK